MLTTIHRRGRRPLSLTTRSPSRPVPGLRYALILTQLFDKAQRPHAALKIQPSQLIILSNEFGQVALPCEQTTRSRPLGLPPDSVDLNYLQAFAKICARDNFITNRGVTPWTRPPLTLPAWRKSCHCDKLGFAFGRDSV